MPLLVFFSLSCFTLAIFHEVLTFNAFGAEFPLFWVYGHGLSFRQVVDSYRIFNLGWYRPTSTALVAWIGDHFIGWHDLVGWKSFHLLSLVLTACSLYWFVLVVAPAARLAALVAAFFYLSHPAQDTLPLQMLPFDALHILFLLLSAGFYWRALQTGGRTSWKFTGLSAALFVIALTCKEVAVALPAFLAVESAIAVFQRRAFSGVRRRIALEMLRLFPFATVIFAYWLFHIRAIQATMGADATYRMAVNWSVIFTNLRMLPLMTIRIFYLAGYKIEWPSYFENTASTAGGIAILLITCAGWFRLVRKRAAVRTAGLLFLAWTGIFLLIPIYSGGQIWHVTTPACGYAALFGMGAAALLHALPRTAWRYAGAAACTGGLLVLGVMSLKDELHHGFFTTPALLTRDLLVHPPIPPEKLGPNPTIYIEDRMNLGGWSYGCYGHLMRYIYQRPDIRESIVPPGKLPAEASAALMKDPEAYYVVYDSKYRWRDATAEMRSELQVLPGNPDLKGPDPLQFTAMTHAGKIEPVTWSLDPAIGAVDPTGWYTAPQQITSADGDSLAIAPELSAVPPLSGVQFVAGFPEPTTVRLTATSTTDSKRSGTTLLTVNVVKPESVEWRIDPPNSGTMTPAGFYEAPVATEPRTVTITAVSLSDRSRTAAARVTIGAPWQTLDLGAVSEPGAYYAGDMPRVRGSGDIFGHTDAFRFVYQAMEGDRSIVARVSTPATPYFTKAGLMIRETLSPQSRHVLAGVISGKTGLLEARPYPNDATSVVFGRSDSPWLRLERKGDTFSAFSSADGTRWEAIGKPVYVRMARHVFVGFAVSSGNHGSSTASFANVRVLPDALHVSAMH